MAKSGAMAMTATPALLPVQVADIAGGSYPAAVQILAALRHKDKTGKGAIIGQLCRMREHPLQVHGGMLTFVLCMLLLCSVRTKTCR